MMISRASWPRRHGASRAALICPTDTAPRAGKRPVISLPFVIYLFAAARRTYAESRWRTAFKTLLLSGWAVAVLTAYRFVLFFTSFYAT